jgi:hypothetical protein
LLTREIWTRKHNQAFGSVDNSLREFNKLNERRVMFNHDQLYLSQLLTRNINCKRRCKNTPFSCCRILNNFCLKILNFVSCRKTQSNIVENEWCGIELVSVFNNEVKYGSLPGDLTLCDPSRVKFFYNYLHHSG